jgi:hypothetical protein
MAAEENNGGVPPRVKLKINKPDTAIDSADSADSGPATIKIKPIKKVAPKTPVVPVDESTIDKPKNKTIQLKESVDTSSVKVDLKPVVKKSETSRIPLDSAVPKPINIAKSESADVVEKPKAISPESKDQSGKSQTSRITLDSIMTSSEEEPVEQPVAQTSRPKTVKLKRPVITPKVTPSVEPSDEGITPTRKKTIKAKKPSAPETPTVDSAAESKGPKLQTNKAQLGGAYIADRFANTGYVAVAEDKPHWVFAVVGVLACVVMAVAIYVQVAQLPNSGLAWVGQILQ